MWGPFWWRSLIFYPERPETKREQSPQRSGESQRAEVERGELCPNYPHHSLLFLLDLILERKLKKKKARKKMRFPWYHWGGAPDGLSPGFKTSFGFFCWGEVIHAAERKGLLTTDSEENPRVQSGTLKKAFIAINQNADANSAFF